MLLKKKAGERTLGHPEGHPEKKKSRLNFSIRESYSRKNFWAISMRVRWS
jgi:hypothetical protein